MYLPRRLRNWPAPHIGVCFVMSGGGCAGWGWVSRGPARNGDEEGGGGGCSRGWFQPRGCALYPPPRSLKPIVSSPFLTLTPSPPHPLLMPLAPPWYIIVSLYVSRNVLLTRNQVPQFQSILIRAPATWTIIRNRLYEHNEFLTKEIQFILKKDKFLTKYMIFQPK